MHLNSLQSHFSQLPCPARGGHIRISKKNETWPLKCLFKYCHSHISASVLLEKRITYVTYQMVIQCESLGNHLMFWGKMEICPVLPCEKLQNIYCVKNIIFLKRKALKSLKWLNKLLSEAKGDLPDRSVM